jgi:hypothetical protein
VLGFGDAERASDMLEARPTAPIRMGQPRLECSPPHLRPQYEQLVARLRDAQKSGTPVLEPELRSASLQVNGFPQLRYSIGRYAHPRYVWGDTPIAA